jgi:Flp pilus assembly protein TadD
VAKKRSTDDLEAARRLRRAGRRRAALAILRRLARAWPGDPDVYFYLAVTLDNLGREREAIPRYHRALRLNPRHPRKRDIFLYLASSYRKTGRPAAARRWLARAEAAGARSPLQRRLRSLLTT